MKEVGPEYITSSSKRQLDVLGGLAIMAGTLPLAVAVGLETSIEHRRLNPFFAQQRIGKMGKAYTNYKFQSLKTRAAGMGSGFGSGHMEASRVGSVVRKTGLDELPQAINVVKGDISLVGIRPLPQNVLDHYRTFVSDDLFEEWFEGYKQNPGLTGEGQLYSNGFSCHTLT